jgi:hypothetical protein
MIMGFFSDASIKGGFSDLLGFFREQRGGGKFAVMLIACLPTALIVWMFYRDALDKAKPPPPTVTYIESWPADRSVQESLTANLEYQKRKDAMRAAEVDAYKALGRAVGMDVDKLAEEGRKVDAEKRAEADAKIAERLKAANAGASK